ncbi:hypothetical protein BaRGS_00034531, partial [Batillaria attramentaria]
MVGTWILGYDRNGRMHLNNYVVNFLCLRYFVIAHPLLSKSLCTTRNAKIALIFTWVAAIVLSSPALVVMGTEVNEYYNDSDNSSRVSVVLCGDFGLDGTGNHEMGRLAYAFWQLVLLFLLPALILFFCYIRVIYILWVSTRQLQTMTGSNRANGRQLPVPLAAADHLAIKYVKVFAAQKMTIVWLPARFESSIALKPWAVSSACPFWMFEAHPERKVHPADGLFHSSSVTRNGHREPSSGNWKVRGGSADRALLSASNAHSTRSPGEDALQARKQVIKMLVVIIVVFLVCWGPQLIINTMKRLSPLDIYHAGAYHAT